MIAPIREVEPPRSTPGLVKARRLVANLMLRSGSERGRRVAAWKAWLIAGWMVSVGAAYAASMLGWL
jgi:hypothetical protein